MKFVAEYYLVKDQGVATEVIEAEDEIEAREKITKKTNKNKRLMFWEELKER